MEETGETFAENARLKALACAEATGLLSLADDSGLGVDALGGAPGVRSARYAEGSDRDRYLKLLEALDGVADAARTAAFHCALCLASPQGVRRRDRGAVPRHHPAGPGGQRRLRLRSGLPGGRRWGGRWPSSRWQEKQAVSHRGRAFAALRPHLESLARQE